MQKLQKIVLESIKSTSEQPHWWILSVGQAFCVVVLGNFVKLQHINFISAGWFLTFILMLQPITVSLWLEAKFVHEKKQENIPVKVYLLHLGRSLLITGIALVVASTVYFTYRGSLFFFILLSFVGGTATLTMLNAVLVRQNVYKSLALAVDFWFQKFSFAVTTSILWGASFMGAFSIFSYVLLFFGKNAGFPVLNSSATIWVLFLVLLVILGFILAFLNCFLVNVFLETIRPVNIPEAKTVNTLSEIV
ncbi:MAG: hypothetical protein JNN11_00630 [Candidatus Doudnabacteria bacterium]|nr:hypothetical protein [Candidatus Doudnabacteria bacterium]